MLDAPPAEIVAKAGGNNLSLLEAADGLYICPVKNGVRIGPLVGYAGRDNQGRQLMGLVYGNFAKIEEDPAAIGYVASRIKILLPNYNINGGTIIGAPYGGWALADALGFATGWRVIKAEKKTVALATETSREKTKLAMSRYDISKGEKIIIVEDVCNNFSTTNDLIRLIENAGGVVVAISCFLNRSPTYRYYYPTLNGNKILPIIALVNKPMDEFTQDDPRAIEAIEKKEVAWKPKEEWPRLQAAMASPI